jgi:hypothetical protein
MQAVGEDGQWENTALEDFERYGLFASTMLLVHGIVEGRQRL